jgi:hypothetical protein
MRYRLAALMLVAVLPVMGVLAAPAPDPWALLDIGPPPKGKTAEQHLKDQIEFKTDLDTLNTVCSYPEVKKLTSVASMKDARPWLAKNLRVAPEEEGRRLRFTFRAGTRNEQVTIINAFLRASLHWNDIGGGTLRWGEACLRLHELNILDLEKRIQATKDPQEAASYQKAIDEQRSVGIPELRAKIARLKQYAVIKWAK